MFNLDGINGFTSNLCFFLELSKRALCLIHRNNMCDLDRNTVLVHDRRVAGDPAKPKYMMLYIEINTIIKHPVNEFLMMIKRVKKKHVGPHLIHILKNIT